MKRKTKCGCDPTDWLVYSRPCSKFERMGLPGSKVCIRCQHYRKCHAAKEKKK